MSDKLRAAAKAVRDAKEILFLREMSVHDKVHLLLEDAINALRAAIEEPDIKESLKAQRPWVGLTDEEITQGNRESLVDLQAWKEAVSWAEAKLREKNT